MNCFYLAGRIVNIENKNNYAIVTINIPRYYKNKEGYYEYDNIRVIVKGNIRDSVVEFCKSGDVIGVTGTIQSLKTYYRFLATKVSYLSAKID